MDALKGALQSKTVWFNSIAGFLGMLDWIQGHAGIISALLPQAAPLVAIVGGVNIILRTITTKSLTEKGSE